MRRWGVAPVISLSLMMFDLGVAHAAGDDKAQCVAASEKAQQLRNAGKLTDAREQLAICGRGECPKLIQQDCTQWMSEVLGILPSVVPGAKDRKGRDLVDVKVLVDGKVVTETLDGKALLVDPGVHTFRFETKGTPAVEEQVVIRQGEKNRILTITFGTTTSTDDPKKGDGKTTEPVKKNPPGDDNKQTPPYAAFVTGGVGVIALGVALYIDLDANAEARKLRDTCAPHCEQSQVDNVENRYVIAGVTAALGGAALIAGVVLYFTHTSGNAKTSSSNKSNDNSNDKSRFISTLGGMGFRF